LVFQNAYQRLKYLKSFQQSAVGNDHWLPENGNRKMGTVSHDAEPHPETNEIRQNNFMAVHHDAAGLTRRR
jgi:hypothetical protein